MAFVDGEGSFTQRRYAKTVGTYTITIKQARNSRLAQWDVKATSSINITP